MSQDLPEIDTPQDALLFCDYLAKFGTGDVSRYYAGLSKVIRSLMRRLEEQAMAREQAEARGGAA